MLIRATPETKIGLTQTIYRIDRKNEDGLVLQAMITKATFTADPDKEKLYIERITNILNSVHFLKSEK
jgi:thiamine kinase-like enzyme